MYPESKNVGSVPVRETEITRVLNRLREATNDLEETAKSFHARLEGVVNGGQDKDRPEEVKSPEFGTKLGQELDNIHSHIYKAGKSLHQLLNRIEL